MRTMSCTSRMNSTPARRIPRCLPPLRMGTARVLCHDNQRRLRRTMGGCGTGDAGPGSGCHTPACEWASCERAVRPVGC